MNLWDEFIEAAELQFDQRLSVTSWYRSAKRNDAVHGVHGSKHLVGDAIDVVWDQAPPPMERLEVFASAHNLKLVRERDHDHFELRSREDDLQLGRRHLV